MEIVLLCLDDEIVVNHELSHASELGYGHHLDKLIQGWDLLKVNTEVLMIKQVLDVWSVHVVVSDHVIDKLESL